ncbi:MurR/RpiR family transcriptional regulator [Mesorhizobium sp. M0862]|uniref:MurR/RpiR family transcriptional regulator n=1 Tax=Mesorhizobium sp. M0862 TaxID=2957015 RepID=UPI00333BE57A
MKRMYVPSERSAAAVLEEIRGRLISFTPELNKAATHVLENSNLISITSIRNMAQGADVKPNTLVRMARALGFEGYEDFRRPFREQVMRGREDFPDRARWLQSLSKGGKLASLYSQMASTSIENIENLFSGTSAIEIKKLADAIVRARMTYVLGVGFASSIARNFAYLASMAVGGVVAIPRDGSLPIDGLVHAEKGDILVAMTFKPYRREIVEAVEVARSYGLKVVGISDSPASPILIRADQRFVIPTNTPQFFPSTVAVTALFETIMAFVVAEAETDAVHNIERFHQRRHDLGIYWKDEQR